MWHYNFQILLKIINYDFIHSLCLHLKNVGLAYSVCPRGHINKYIYKGALFSIRLILYEQKKFLNVPMTMHQFYIVQVHLTVKY